MDERGHAEKPITTQTGVHLITLADALNCNIPDGAALTVDQIARYTARDVAAHLQRLPGPNTEPPLASDAAAMWRAQRRYLPFRPAVEDAVSTNTTTSPSDDLPAKLKPDGLVHVHKLWCKDASCRRAGDECWRASWLRNLAVHGADPKLNFEPDGKDYEDNKSCSMAAEGELDSAFDDELARGVVEPADDDDAANPRTFVRKHKFVVLEPPPPESPAPGASTPPAGPAPPDDADCDTDIEESMEDDEHIDASAALWWNDIAPGLYKLKTRMCIDLSRPGALNDATPQVPMRYASIEHVLRLLTPGCWVQSRDIVKGFNHVHLSRNLRRFMAFRHSRRGADGVREPRRRWRYRSMPFGWRAAPFVFSLLTAEICAAMAAAGYTATCYVDDILVIADTREECEEAGRYLNFLLEKAGFDFHKSGEKAADSKPSQRIVYLGFVIDTVRFTIAVPRDKCEALRSEIMSALESSDGRIPIRVFSSILGRLQWATSVFRGGRAHLRGGWMLKARAHTNRWKFVMRRDVEPMFHFFLTALSTRTADGGHGFLRAEARIWSSVVPVPVVVSKGDSSGDDHAGFGLVYGGDVLCGRWADKVALSTTTIELVPLLCGLRQFGDEWKGRLVVFGTDNSGTFFGINAGRLKGGINEAVDNALLAEIFDLCFEHSIDLLASWVPRSFNQLADDLSKLPLEALHARFPSLIVVPDPLPDIRRRVAQQAAAAGRKSTT